MTPAVEISFDKVSKSTDWHIGDGTAHHSQIALKKGACTITRLQRVRHLTHWAF
jgi:hypothetical protein